MDIDRHNFVEDVQQPLIPQVHTLGDDPMAPTPNSSQVAEAFERRLRQQREEEQLQETSGGYTAFDAHHEKRQEFRRMIDPGILRPNARSLALESLRTLLKLAENILEHPDEPKYQRFKPTNPNIKRLLVDPKGSLEFARALGFNPEVEKFQPLYVFNAKRHMQDLRIGAEILKEALERELTKEEVEERRKKEEKAIAAAQVEKIKQAFLDDRKSRTLQERREREVREARAQVAARRSSLPPASTALSRQMPGSGHTLNGGPVTIDEGQNADDADDADDDDDDDD